MYQYIPNAITWALNNKVTWALYSKVRNIDDQLDTDRGWIDSGEVIYSTEPQSLSIRDAAIIQQSSPLAIDRPVCKIWAKNLELDWQIYNYALKMTARTTPPGKALDLIVGKYLILSDSLAYGVSRDSWISLAFDPVPPAA